MKTSIKDKHHEMVDQQLKARGIDDACVLKAMMEVPRHEFLPSELKDVAYGDFPLPIGDEQTISQPYIVALMTQALELKADDTVLEIGLGSGYQAAILSRIVKTVYSVERIPALAARADSVLKKLCYLNIHVVVGDGGLGLKKHALYDAIIVTAACSTIPQALKDQLKDGGRIVIPVGEPGSQELLKIVKTQDEFVEKKLCDCAFVLLIST